MVSPDAGGVERARAYAKRLDADPRHRGQAPRASRTWPRCTTSSATSRAAPRSSWTTSWTPAGTLAKVAEALKDAGAREVLASRSHAVLSGQRHREDREEPASQLIVTDSIPLSDEKRRCEKIVVLSIAELMGKAIRNIHEEASVTSLFV